MPVVAGYSYTPGVVTPATASAALEELGSNTREVTVTLSNELVHLLSEQMYRSPIKAIEELVVNSYDAEAATCRLVVPLPPEDSVRVLVFDDGHGMDVEGLEDLWHIGRSNKRELEIAKLLKRKQIGKFGIGKLATYSIANQVTYISKTAAGLHGVSLDFREFARDPTGGKPISLDVKSLPEEALADDPRLAELVRRLDLDQAELSNLASWTMAILEDLKPKMGRIRRRDLLWVLSTAMPLGADFKLILDGDPIESRKASYDELVRFDVEDLPAARLETLREQTGSDWRLEGGALVSEAFPNGIKGSIVVTKQSLYAGKSGDLARSHGFFVRVRGRLVDESDPLLGIEPLSYEVFNRFRADLVADDLDAVVTAPREGFEASDEVDDFQKVLVTLFYEARAQFETCKRDAAEAEKRRREDERDYVRPDFVEHPLADALASRAANGDALGSDADDEWFYLRLADDVDIQTLITDLYSPERKRYRYSDVEGGRSGRLVEFDPVEATFYINVDHPVVQAHADPKAQGLIEDMLTAEVLLEVYLRENGVPGRTIGEVLERRDVLLRSLASDHIFSLTAIAADLRQSSDDEHDLEVNLVIAARALGFVAKHLGGAGRADGVARLTDYPAGETRLILEAKSSGEVPSLGAIDFGGLHQHMVDEKAQGCLLVAPAYPGGSSKDAAAAKRAENLRISCWTVEQLASVVEAAEARYLSAVDIVEVVTTAFKPDDVSAAVAVLLSEPDYVPQALHAAVVDALRALHGRMTDQARTIDHVAAEVTSRPEFRNSDSRAIEKAVRAVAATSQGLLQVTDRNRLIIRGDYDELDRRVAQLTGRAPKPRRRSTFKVNDDDTQAG